MKNFTSKVLCLVFTLALGINLMHSNYKESDSGFLTTHVDKVSPGISDLDEVPIQCSGEAVIPEYEVDGEWLSGNNDLVVAEGTSLKLSGLPNKLSFSIELPSGEIVGDDYDLGSVTPSQNGTYIVRSHQGCETIIALTVEGSSTGDTGNESNCDGAAVIPEYRINGEWLSGNNQVTVEEGTAVELSGLPNSLSLSIQLPNGQIVGDDYNLGNVTPEANGTYIVRSSGGCETTIMLTVEGGNTENPNPDTTCNGRTVIPEYEVDGEWLSGDNELVLEEGTALKLSGLPNSLSLSIILPTGEEVADDYDLGTITSSDEGTYIVRSSEGCESAINLTVTGGETACEGENVIPEYQIDGEWLSGENRISVPQGTPVVISGLPNTLSLMVELPNGEIQDDDFSLGNITTAQAGTYTIRSSQGCSTTLTIDVIEEPTADCVGETIIPEYQVDGEWLDGDKQLSISEGTMLVLSGLPNSLRLSIELPNGSIVGDDYDLGSVTPSDSGTYIIRSEEGCEVSFALTVTDDGNSGPEDPGGDGPAVGAQRVEAETEAEAEVESETDDGVAAGSVAVGAAGAALSPNSAAVSRTSGSISKSTNVPAERLNPDESTSQGGSSDGAPEPGDNESGGDTTDEGSEAEAEAEAESEAEAEVANGAAVAVGGSAVSAAGGGRSVYLDDEGRLVLYPSEATLGADAKTSTSTSTSKVNITFPANNEPQGGGGSGGGGTGGGGGDGGSPITTIGEKTTINEDSPININVLSNDTGPIDPTTVAIESQPSNGIAVVNADGTVRYTPDANFNGEDSFVYSVGDGNGNKSNGVVDVTVTPINDLPTVTGTIPDQNGVVGQVFNYTIPSDLFSDPDANDRQLSLSVTNLPSGLKREGTQIVGTPRAPGDFKVAVQATDEAGATVQTDFNLNIRAQGASNVTTVADTATTDENTATTVRVLDNDQGPVDSATVAIERQPSNGRAAANPDGTVTYTPNPGFSGGDSFVYSVRDTDGVKATGTVSVTVNNTNDGPVVDQGIADQTATVGTSFMFTIPANAFSDPDGTSEFSYTATNVPSGITFSESQFAGTPTAAGSTVITVTATDEAGASAQTDFTLTVSGSTGGGGGGEGGPVTANEEEFAVLEDSSTDFDVLSNDSGPIDISTLTVTGPPSNGTATANANGTVTYEPSLNYVGEDSFMYSIGDGNGNTSSTTVSLQVDPVNDTPVVDQGIADQTAVVGENYMFTIPSNAFSDPDLDSQLSITSMNLPSGLNFEDTKIVGIPSQAGSFVTTIMVEDEGGLTASTTYTTTVQEAGSGTGGDGGGEGSSTVTANEEEFTVQEDSSNNFDVLSNDTGEINPSTVAIESQASNGTATPNSDGTITYEPALNFFGSDSFSYSVGDGNGSRSQTTVSLSINNVNDSPVVDQGIANQTAQVGQNFSFTIPMNAFSDPDPDAQLSITAMNLPPGLAFEDTKIVGMPQQAGSFTVTISVEDEGGLTASTMFDISVSNASTARAARMASLNAKKNGIQTFSAPVAKGTSLTARGPGAGLPFADPDTVPIIQTDTEAEVESESEAEAEAETVTGAAAAVATGGSAVAAVGDFAEADALVSVASSTSTSEVNEEQPELFANMNEDSAGGATATKAASPNINNTKAVSAVAFKASDILNIPQPTDGKGLFESESEAEAEAEAEAEVDNNAAAASAVASGGGGANGIGATARVASSTAVSTSTENNNGTLNRANDEVDEESNRFDELVSTQSEAEVEVEAEAEAEAGNGRPTAIASAGTVALGDVTAEAQLTLQDAGVTAPAGSSARQLPSDFPWVEESFYKKGDRIEAVGVEMARGIFNVADKSLRSVTSRAVPLGNLESENEAEAEAEAEAEVGFNAAAASASAVSVQAKNGLVPLPANAASATSTSTSVFDNGENKNNHESFPGAAEQGNYGDLPDLDVDLDGFILETETEAEAEAEVGFEAAAASVAASAAGYEGIQAKTAFATTPYASAAAAGSGARVTLSVITPAENEAGIVAASATATDPQGRGVAVAVAVAGVPFEDGSDNESEAEQEGLTIATVNVSVFTDPADAQNPRMLPMGDDGEGSTGGSATDADNEGESVGETEIESEAEAEAEAESEAAYGVAAASAAATASGIGAVASANTSTSTMAYDGSYELNTTTASVANFTARAESSDAVLNWKSVGVEKFAVDHMVNGTYEEIGTVESANQGKSEDYMFRMYGLEADQEHRFRLRPLKSSIGAQEASFTLETSDVFSISAPYPNVMTSRTQTEVAVKRDQKVTAKVYDMSGRVINTLYDDVMKADLKENLIWVPGQSIPNGLYFIKIEGKDFTETFKVILRK
ncbi:tandem-95 repeat protein [Aggregatimonas sangjinii]|uniref:Tandem-95 repeat protein n=1 Tax=Aggregatimonas sangjinii TaxID=2583587 RepID=A0A5B7SU75_9FLAO|nr:tandem-95 repeat protein [Aggregatimonas sangjinii]QCX00274.1 tandem-95 repeat protein [Aggregatimonas sangjinii]